MDGVAAAGFQPVAAACQINADGAAAGGGFALGEGECLLGQRGEAFGVRRGDEAAELADLFCRLRQPAFQQKVGCAEPFGGLPGGGNSGFAHYAHVYHRIDFLCQQPFERYGRAAPVDAAERGQAAGVFVEHGQRLRPFLRRPADEALRCQRVEQHFGGRPGGIQAAEGAGVAFAAQKLTAFVFAAQKLTAFVFR